MEGKARPKASGQLLKPSALSLHEEKASPMARPSATARFITSYFIHTCTAFSTIFQQRS